MTRQTSWCLALAFSLASTGGAAAQVANPAGKGSLQADMRRLWEDHVSWTRMFIISAATNLPDKSATLDRLMRNQEDIGNAMKPFYGDSAGQRLTELLKDHIRIAGEVLEAAAQANQPMVADASKRWGTNAENIATALAGANPAHWKFEELNRMLHEHLDLTTKEATAYLAKNWKESIDAYEKVHAQALAMADALSSGIMKQFPQKAAM
jgi:DNA polymerase III delta prime subunit